MFDPQFYLDRAHLLQARYEATCRVRSAIMNRCRRVMSAETRAYCYSLRDQIRSYAWQRDQCCECAAALLEVGRPEVSAVEVEP